MKLLVLGVLMARLVPSQPSEPAGRQGSNALVSGARLRWQSLAVLEWGVVPWVHGGEMRKSMRYLVPG